MPPLPPRPQYQIVDLERQVPECGFLHDLDGEGLVLFKPVSARVEHEAVCWRVDVSRISCRIAGAGASVEAGRGARE